MEKPTTETDSLPRVQVRDMLIILRLLEGPRESTLENVRLRLCTDRKGQRRGDYLFSTARDTVSELQRLGLLEGGPFPKDSRDYPKLKDKPINVTREGHELALKFSSDRAAAYDDLFAKMYQAHRHLREYARVLSERPLFAPVLTSVKDHISTAYAEASALAEEISNGEFRGDDMIESLQRRLKRPLSGAEQKEIQQGTKHLITDTRMSATSDEPTVFAKKLLQKVNDLVIPAVLRECGLDLDFRTHRAAWSLGEEFLVWSSTTWHPEYSGSLVFPTATLDVSKDRSKLERVIFRRAADLESSFLPRLFNAYTKLQKLERGTYVQAWELRAVFCFENQCPPSVFNRLFEQQYARSDGYELHLEIQRQLPRHETPLRAGARNIGSVRVVKK
jgi:hypothetical protein